MLGGGSRLIFDMEIERRLEGLVLTEHRCVPH
jgi:hypothetical protein